MPRIQSPAAADMIGLSVRSVQDKAARGEIPSAAKVGARWTFDKDTLKQWMRQLEAKNCQTSIGATELGTPESRFGVRTTVEAYERALKF